MPTTGTVFIVDDDVDVRQSWECILAAAGLPSRGFPTAEDFLEHADLNQPCCLILDLRMPGMGGQKLLETMRQRHSPIPVIIISGHADVPTVVQTMKLGLVDFLTKPVDPVLLVTKIRTILHDAADFQRRMGDVPIIKSRLTTLTSREMEVLKLLNRGLLHKQIARELRISTRTVDHHHAQINLKMQANNSADLMRMCFLAGLL